MVKGIGNLNELITFFDEQANQVKVGKEQDKKYEFINIECKRLQKHVHKLEIQGFRRNFWFTRNGDMLLSSVQSNPEQNQIEQRPFSTKMAEVSSNLKTSTAPVKQRESLQALIEHGIAQMTNQHLNGL
ncbi:MAG: hypothetical protein EZS28_005789 [Streblomastix strix]|uniref:Uncharacterized protein n=1 Tax=Streblomastix strix TaxID=222440 RepID=A0A5J4WUH3_9EUKA|nr:MAG: hypothetical protein EZS28_005789 [Streblomastix strix]